MDTSPDLNNMSAIVSSAGGGISVAIAVDISRYCAFMVCQSR